MTYLHATIYGLVQGISEFLPISSSGHLALLPKIMEFKDPGVAFDLAMHVGTAFAIICYFWRELLSLLDALISKLKGQEDERSYYAVNLLIASVATVALVLVVKDFASTYARNPTWIAVNLMAFGAFMFVSDKFAPESGVGQFDTPKGFKKAILIGLAQAVAVFPGVSRSGITIGCARAMKVGRIESARFSFLLSLPIILGGFILKSRELTVSGSVGMGHCLVGMLVSFVVGILTIHFFMKLISKIGLVYFVAYRFLIAAILLYIF